MEHLNETFGQLARSYGLLRMIVLVATGASVTKCGADVTLVINNAGLASTGGSLGDASSNDARAMLETNLFGALHVSRARTRALAKNGGGAIGNVLSVSSWISGPLALDGTSKSAAWPLINALRIELEAQKTQVLALHADFIDTGLTRDINAPKSSPETIVRTAFEGLNGAGEVLADNLTRSVHARPTAEPPIPIYLQAQRV